MAKQPPPPFSYTFSPNLPELLSQLDCTLVISTYQAGKVVFLSAKDDERLVQLPRTFPHAMAVGLDDDKMAIATRDEVVVLKNEPSLAPRYPNQPDTYDNFFTPRASYYTGRVDIHGLDWGKEGLWAVVTAFSTLALVDDNYSFTPKWRPPFISSLAAEDRCHLNGVVMEEDIPKYVTALSDTDEAQGWRKVLPNGGVLMDVPSGEILLRDLAMPHSPRMYNGQLYMLLSANGELVQVDLQKGSYETVNTLQGFTRGMARCGDYLFIGRSRLRKNSSTFRDLPIAKKADSSGVTVIHLPTGALVGALRFESSVDEIYDVQVLPQMKRPGILNTEGDTYRRALTIPEGTFWAAAEADQ